MRNITIILLLALYSPGALGSVGGITCDNQIGEIYFTGVHPRFYGCSGFYYSSDGGENIELRDSTISIVISNFGSLLADAADSTLYRLTLEPTICHYVSTNGGFDWITVNNVVTTGMTYASGVITGELYRCMAYPHDHLLERSCDYGREFISCSCYGFPDTTWIYSTALGVNSGEVYIWAPEGNLYYSSDYAEHFNYLGNLTQSSGVHPWTLITNGAEPGEIYIFHHDSQRIWRAYNYGEDVELIEDFNLGSSWQCSISASREPGEVYMRAMDPNMTPGGIIRIYRTTNYGQDWTLYEHYIPYNGIKSEVFIIPADVGLHAWPNPANPVFTVEYSIQFAGSVKISLLNTLGRKVWQHQTGFQLPGRYQLTVNNQFLPSGHYILQLLTKERRTARTITILK